MMLRIATRLISGLIVLCIISSCTMLRENLPASPEPRQVVRSTLPLRIKWTTTRPDHFRGPPLVQAGWVVGRSDKALTIYDGESGRELWSDTADYASIPGSSIAISNDTLAFATERTTILKLVNLREMKLNWSYGSGSLISPQLSSLAVDSSAVYGSWSRPATIAAYDLRTGKLLWTQMKGDWSYSYNLQPRGEDLYVFNAESAYILDRHTGVVKRQLEDKFKGTGFQVVADTLYEWFPDKLVAVDISSGEARWEFHRNRGRCNGVDHVFNGRLYATVNCTGLAALDSETGGLYWQTQFSSTIDSAVVSVGDTGYVMLDDGSIVGFDLVTGKQSGSLITNCRIMSPYYLDEGLATDGTYLYATFGDNTLFAFSR